jgi:peptidyl-prolyl cis-trans isomerase D
MMMRTMRQFTKWVFVPLAILFVMWLAIGQVQEILSGGRDVVLKVDGTSIHYQQFQLALQAALEQYRQQGGSAQLSDEEEKQVEDRVVDQLVQEVVLQQAYHRLGITVSDQEVIDAAKSSPPSEVMQLPDFQTNKQFDITKWQRFLASGSNPQFLMELEGRYREQIPQLKLAQYLTSDVYVSDAKLWRIWRDQRESVTVAMLPILPQAMPDSAVSVTDADLTAYFRAHPDEFKRPAVAFTSFIAEPRAPDAADTAAALARAQRIRAEVLGATPAKFGDVAKRESADSISAAKGGDLGWIARDEQGFDPGFLAGLRTLKVGQVSTLALSQFGYHVIRVDSARKDSVRARHILVPIELLPPHRDRVESRADTLDRLAAEHDDRTVLDSVSTRLGLHVATAPALIDGDRMTLGRYVIPDVSVWAFTARPGQTSKVIEGERAYYVFRLDSVRPAGVPPMGEVRDQVAYATRLSKKRDLARTRAREIASRLAGAADLMQGGAAQGLAAERLGPFTRIRPPAILEAEPTVLGAAFGLKVGERSGLVEGQNGEFLVQALARTRADSVAWLAQRDRQREALLQPARQTRIQSYLAALKARAKVVDRRKEIFKAQTDAAGS